MHRCWMDEDEPSRTALAARARRTIEEYRLHGLTDVVDRILAGEYKAQ